MTAFLHSLVGGSGGCALLEAAGNHKASIPRRTAFCPDGPAQRTLSP